MKATVSKAAVARINLAIITLFVVAYLWPLLTPAFLYPKTRRISIRSSKDHSEITKLETSTVIQQTEFEGNRKPEAYTEGEALERVVEVKPGMKIVLLNLQGPEIHEWENTPAETTVIKFQEVSPSFAWNHLFPEWIDEEEENHAPACPEIPMPDFMRYTREFDMVVARLPCKFPIKGWKRDVYGLQIHLIAANLGVRNGKAELTKMKFLFLSSCVPMIELFKPKELVKREGEAWLYDSELVRLEQMVSLPIGSCKLALPLWKQGRSIEIADVWKKGTVTELPGYDSVPKWPWQRRQQQPAGTWPKREAYVTVLHSSEQYVCGAITLAQSLLWTNTTRDLVILLDKSITKSTRLTLRSAGWTVRNIKRIRNPKAEKGTYNEYNYSKLRIWQLTDYDRVVFIDSDVVVLRNMDMLFDLPEMSASGNDGDLFNSGVMVIEPSNGTFEILMKERKRVESYNGGDQGFLNEVFTWWHRLPRRVNFLKNQWSNKTREINMKNQLYGSHPPELYALHYLGLKPWHCYRDYDCNYDIDGQVVFASDVAHRRWWKVHDAMDPGSQKLCLLTPTRKNHLEWNRNLAKKARLGNGRWKIKIRDPRKTHVI